MTDFVKLCPFSVFLLVAISTGCQTLTTSSMPPAGPPASDVVLIEVRPTNGKPRRLSMPLTPETRLQNVIDGSHARFRNKEVFIVRVSPTTGQQHKLYGEFDARGKVTLETDYALHPGDRVVVAQDSTTGIERAVLSMLGRSS